MVSRKQLLKGQSALLSTELLAFYRQVSQSLLTVVDVETTGSLPYKARVIEISVLQASLKQGIHYQETFLINPGVKIPKSITQITGITPAMVEDRGLYPEEVWPEILPRLRRGVLTAHNLGFDYSFLQSEYRHHEIRFTRSEGYQFCTVLLSRLLLADLPSRSLPNLVEHFGFDVGPSHRAEADTKACWLLAKHLLTQIQSESDEALLHQFGQQWVRLRDAAKLLQMPKGKVSQTLDGWGAEQLTSRGGNRVFYRRKDVERLYHQLECGTPFQES